MTPRPRRAAVWDGIAPWKVPASKAALVDEYGPEWAGLPSVPAGVSYRAARCPVCGASLVVELLVDGRRDRMHADPHLVVIADGSLAATQRRPRRPLTMDRRVGPPVTGLPVRVHCWTPTCGDLLVDVDEPTAP